jgi:hypothetical protein
MSYVVTLPAGTTILNEQDRVYALSSPIQDHVPPCGLLRIRVVSALLSFLFRKAMEGLDGVQCTICCQGESVTSHTTANAKFCFCKNNKRMIIIDKTFLEF